MGEALELMASMRLESHRRWGEVATDFQLDDAGAVLEPAEGDPLLHWLSRSKGTSKTTDVSAFACSWLVAQAQPLDKAYVAAADLEQADRLLNLARGLDSTHITGRCRPLLRRRSGGPRTRYSMRCPGTVEASPERAPSRWLRHAGTNIGKYPKPTAAPPLRRSQNS
jgi:hypothetical protein